MGRLPTILAAIGLALAAGLAVSSTVGAGVLPSCQQMADQGLPVCDPCVGLDQQVELLAEYCGEECPPSPMGLIGALCEVTPVCGDPHVQPTCRMVPVICRDLGTDQVCGKLFGIACTEDSGFVCNLTQVCPPVPEWTCYTTGEKLAPIYFCSDPLPREFCPNDDPSG